MPAPKVIQARATRTTIAWRVGIFGLAVAAVPSGIHLYDEQRTVDTEAMLDVSVSIKTFSHVRTDEVGDSVWTTGSGSGFVVSAEDCEVWTANHVIADAAIIEVRPRGWKAAYGIPATVVNSTPRSDIAMLRMERCPGLTAAKFGDSDRLRAGAETYAVGNPLGNNPDSISRGIISHTERFVVEAFPYLQTDAAINPGNSGGALFNRRGEVIGINTAIATNGSGQNMGIGYAIPINLAHRVVERLREGPPSWGDVGISDLLSPLTPDQAAIFRVPDGYQAVSLTASPAEGPGGGKLFARDVIFRIDGRQFRDANHANRIISQGRPGDPMVLELVRNGRVTEVGVTVAEGWKPPAAPVPEPYDGYLGMSLAMWQGEKEEHKRFEHPVITRVHGLGPAHRGHIASSQQGVGLRGPFMVMVQLDVKTISGVVLEGVFHPVHDVASVDRFAAQAHRSGTPMLLEIETWARPDGADLNAPLRHRETRYHKLLPALANRADPGTAPGEIASMSTAVLEEPRFADDELVAQYSAQP